jgi:hypothetical protein
MEGLEGGYKMRILEMLKSSLLTATAYHLLKYDILKIIESITDSNVFFHLTKYPY